MGEEMRPGGIWGWLGYIIWYFVTLKTYIYTAGVSGAGWILGAVWKINGRPFLYFLGRPTKLSVLTRNKEHLWTRSWFLFGQTVLGQSLGQSPLQSTFDRKQDSHHTDVATGENHLFVKTATWSIYKTLGRTENTNNNKVKSRSSKADCSN